MLRGDGPMKLSFFTYFAPKNTTLVNIFRLMQTRCSLVHLEGCDPIGAGGPSKASRRKPPSKCNQQPIASPSSMTTTTVSPLHRRNPSTMAEPASLQSVGLMGVGTVGKGAIVGRAAWEGERAEKVATLGDTVTRKQRDPVGRLLCLKQRWSLVCEGLATSAQSCWRPRPVPSWKSSLDLLTWRRPSFASPNSTIHKPFRASLRICSILLWNAPAVTARQPVD